MLPTHHQNTLAFGCPVQTGSLAAMGFLLGSRHLVDIGNGHRSYFLVGELSAPVEVGVDGSERRKRFMTGGVPFGLEETNEALPA